MPNAVRSIEDKFKTFDHFLAVHIDDWFSQPATGKAVKSVELAVAGACVAGAMVIYNEFHNEIGAGMHRAADQVQRVAQATAQRLGLVRMEME